MTDRTTTEALIGRFFDSLSVRDFAGAMDCLGEDLIHDTPYGEREIGWEAFERFMIHRRQCYRMEYDAVVVLSDATGRRGAAEFVLKATYNADDDKLGPDVPKAKGQVATLNAGAFFEVDEDKISRLSFMGDRAAFKAQLER